MELEIIRNIVAGVAGMNADEIRDDASFADGLRIYCTDISAILMKVEAEFDVRFPDEAYTRVDSVKDIQDCLKKL